MLIYVIVADVYNIIFFAFDLLYYNSIMVDCGLWLLISHLHWSMVRDQQTNKWY